MNTKKSDGNNNKWALAFILSEIAILLMLLFSYFQSKNFWILIGAVVYFVFSIAMFIRLLDERKKQKEDGKDGKKK